MTDPKGIADRAAWRLALVGAIGVAAGAVITGGFNYFSHRGDVDAKMIELSVGILRSDPTPETIPLREWAIDVIDKRAKFSFNEAQRAALLSKQLPFRGGFSGDSYSYDGPDPGPTARSPRSTPNTPSR